MWRKVHSPLPHDSRLRSLLDLDKSRRASVPTRLRRSSPSRYDYQQESRKSPSHSRTGDEEPTSDVTAEYQEWPMRGVLKRVIVRDEIRYGMEFSIEETHGLMCQQHTVAHDSTNCEDSQPGDMWEIHKITGMRKVDGVEEFHVAWEPTWMPESELGGARELVEEFRARLSVRHGKNRQGETGVSG